MMDFPFKPRENFIEIFFFTIIVAPSSLSDPKNFTKFCSTWWVVEALKVVSSHPGRDETKK